MSKRARVIVAGAVAFGALLGMVAIVVHEARDEPVSGPGTFRLGATAAASAPFAAFSETKIAFDDRCRRVLVASTSAQRTQGLRGVRDLGAYDGMLFVFPGDSFARFTMAQTPLPLDIGWYSAAGKPLDHARMKPCPRGTDASCPAYGSRHRYRYALETRSGSAGAISACAA